MQDTANKPLTEDQLSDLVASTDTGARRPAGNVGKVLSGIALAWTLFQLWIASPLPFIVSDLFSMSLVLNSTESRAIHLAFGIFLAYTAYPALKSSPRDYIPIGDWILSFLGAISAAYIYIFYNQMAARVGNPSMLDLVIGAIGIVVLLEATRRSLGLPLVIISLLFLSYIFFGNSPALPEVIQWKGASFNKAITHLWLTTEGVFGIPLGVSASFIFLFVLLGALLEKGGAGNYFIKIAFALLGHLRGGPAKAAVLASGMTGFISGSSIANVVTTGTFTIPLMRRVGFSAEKAGAVEVSASVNGQIMPPVMGAAAFIMVDFTGIPYSDVIKHAFLPAVISYIALLYLVHLEALKAGMQGLPKEHVLSRKQRLLKAGITFTSIIILAGLVYYVTTFLQSALGEASAPVLGLLVIGVYVFTMWLAAQVPDLEPDDPTAEEIKLPVLGEVAKTGFFFIIPIVILVWLLMIEQKSPALAAFWAVTTLIFITLTQHPVKAFFRKQLEQSTMISQFKRGWTEMIDGFITGARNMIGIAIATACAGIIVGAVTLTGIPQVMAEFVEYISGGNLILILIFTAIICLILGMGLPTTANYIVVASIMAPVIVQLGAATGLIVPLIAVHMFVFYFGIMADVTPPVGLASFAAAAVSGGDPIRTGLVAFFYSLRTALLPFFFIFNLDLLLFEVDFLHGVIVFVVATLAMLIFAAGTQGYFFAKSRIWESVALLLVAFTLFRPGFWMDIAVPPYQAHEPTQVYEVVEELGDGATLRAQIEGPDVNNPGTLNNRILFLDLGSADRPPQARIEDTGLRLLVEEDQVLLEEPALGSEMEGTLSKMDFYADRQVRLVSISVPQTQPAKEWFFIPAILVLGLIIVLQRRRTDVPAF